MRQQCTHSGELVLARQLGFSKHRMDLTVANPMHKHRLAPSFTFPNKVVNSGSLDGLMDFSVVHQKTIREDVAKLV